MGYKINFKNPQSRTHPYWYKCKDCGTTQELHRMMSDISPVVCECGGECNAVINSAPIVSLDPISGDHVGATDKWVKGRERKMAKERHNLKEHGTYN